MNLGIGGSRKTRPTLHFDAMSEATRHPYNKCTMTQQRIYLDNAATSWPKPEAVYEAVDHYQREIGAPNGRSGYSHAQESNRIVDRARRGVAALIGASDPLASRLRLQLHRRAQHGHPRHRPARRPRRDHRLRPQLRPPPAASAVRRRRRRSHLRSVRRPGIRFAGRCARRPPPRHAARGRQSCLERHRLLCSQSTKSAASSAKAGRFYLVDAAQSLGHVPLDVRNARSRSAGRAGPQRFAGTARHRRALHAAGNRTRIETASAAAAPARQSDEDRQPDVLPDKYEPGNHNLPGLAGLAAATDFLRTETDRSHPRAPHATRRAIARTACAKSKPSTFTDRCRPKIARASSASPSTATRRKNSAPPSNRHFASNAAPASNVHRECTKHSAQPPAAAHCGSAPATRQRSKKSTWSITRTTGSRKRRQSHFASSNS